MFHLINDSELQVTFDVSGADDHLPSIAFDITILWNMPFQKARIEMKECWFECVIFDEFESALQKLKDQKNGIATLKNMSNNPIITFTKSGQSLTKELFCQDTTDMGQITLKVNGYESELTYTLDKLKYFAKWW
jgi:hypothetical protein